MPPISFKRALVEPVRTRPLVLLIEGDDSQLDLYARLIDEDLSVLTASRGETGYALACSEEPDVVMIGVRLPDVDGSTICQRLRANPDTASIPVVMFTRPYPADLLLATLHCAIEQVRAADMSKRPRAAAR
jgi:DNA-binding response OmpR family regulator